MWKKSKILFPLYQRFFRKQEIPYHSKEQTCGGVTGLVRTVNHGDIKELLAVEREVYQGEVPWSRSAFLLEITSHIPHLYLVYECSGQIVAFAGCRFQKEDGHVTNIAVRPKYQKNGIGTFFLQEFMNAARAQQCATLSLEVRKSNMDAQRLYRKIGFVSRNIKKNYYHENHEDALEMVLDLKEVYQKCRS